MSFCSGKKIFRHRRYTQQKDGAITQNLVVHQSRYWTRRTAIIYHL